MTDQMFTDSITIKTLSPDGFDIMLTLRGPSKELLPRAMGALDWLKSQDFKPTTNRPAAPVGNGSAPLCPTHNQPMKPSKHGGYFCPVKIAEDDGAGKPVYCKQKVK